jgi:hypothetical protein
VVRALVGTVRLKTNDHSVGRERRNMTTTTSETQTLTNSSIIDQLHDFGVVWGAQQQEAAAIERTQFNAWMTTVMSSVLHSCGSAGALSLSHPEGLCVVSLDETARAELPRAPACVRDAIPLERDCPPNVAFGFRDDGTVTLSLGRTLGKCALISRFLAWSIALILPPGWTTARSSTYEYDVLLVPPPPPPSASAASSAPTPSSPFEFTILQAQFIRLYKDVRVVQKDARLHFQAWLAEVLLQSLPGPDSVMDENDVEGCVTIPLVFEGTRAPCPEMEHMCPRACVGHSGGCRGPPLAGSFTFFENGMIIIQLHGPLAWPKFAVWTADLCTSPTLCVVHWADGYWTKASDRHEPRTITTMSWECRPTYEQTFVAMVPETHLDRFLALQPPHATITRPKPATFPHLLQPIMQTWDSMRALCKQQEDRYVDWLHRVVHVGLQSFDPAVHMHTSGECCIPLTLHDPGKGIFAPRAFTWGRTGFLGDSSLWIGPDGTCSINISADVMPMRYRAWTVRALTHPDYVLTVTNNFLVTSMILTRTLMSPSTSS